MPMNGTSRGPMATQVVCPQCGKRNVILDRSTGELVCKNDGTVIESRVPRKGGR